MKQQGFTLVEFVLTAAIVGILGAVAVRAYQQSLERASFAQQLVDIGHIRKVIEIEARDGGRDLLAGSRPGKAPGPLAAQLPDHEFTDGRGLRLQLVHVPPSALHTAGPEGSYGLVADSTGSPDRLWLFQREVERAGFATAWLSERSFVFSIVDFAEASVAAPSPSQPPPAVSQPPAVPAPPTETPGGCGPGQEARGQSGECRPVADGGSCPPGWELAGQSGNCRPGRK